MTAALARRGGSPQVSVYSHSRISSFENCPLQYRFRYIDRVPTKVQGIEAFMGRQVHEVLERLFADPGRARASRAEEFGDMFSELWRREYTPEIRVVREEMSAEDYHDLGRRCVESFFRRHHPFDASVAGTEVKVEFTLDPESRYRMLGYIDRIDRPAPDRLEIHDYKTGALPRRGSLERDRQLTLYEIALRARWPQVRSVKQVWHYLAHDREFVQVRSDEDLQRTRLKTIQAIRNIESTAVFPARRSPLCSWCDYKNICPEWKPRDETRPVTGPPPPAPVSEPRTGQLRFPF